METGFFIHFANHYRLSWFWFVIILSFQQVISIEGKLGHTIVMRIIWLAIWAFFIYLAWPRRFMIEDNQFYITKIFSSKLLQVDTDYVTAVKFGKHSFEFSFAGKHYRFLTVGNASRILKEKFAQLDTSSQEEETVETTETAKAAEISK